MESNVKYSLRSQTYDAVDFFLKKIITHFIKNLFKYVKVQIILNKTDDQSCGKKSTVSYHTFVIGRSINRLMF